MINWKVNRNEAEQIRLIVKRAMEVAANHGQKISAIDLNMDITACHANGCPLQLEQLAAADTFDFTHDVWGIMRHINRETGKLENCFLPRYSVRETAKP